MALSSQEALSLKNPVHAHEATALFPAHRLQSKEPAEQEVERKISFERSISVQGFEYDIRKGFYHPIVPNLYFASNSLSLEMLLASSFYLLELVARHPEALSLLKETVGKNLTVFFKKADSYLVSGLLLLNNKGMRQIHLVDSLKDHELLDAFIFELFNAYNSREPEVVKQILAKDREEFLKKFKTADDYATTLERREYLTNNQTSVLLHEGISKYHWPKSLDPDGIRPQRTWEEHLKSAKTPDHRHRGFSHFSLYCKVYYDKLLLLSQLQIKHNEFWIMYYIVTCRGNRKAARDLKNRKSTLLKDCEGYQQEIDKLNLEAEGCLIYLNRSEQGSLKDAFFFNSSRISRQDSKERFELLGNLASAIITITGNQVSGVIQNREDFRSIATSYNRLKELTKENNAKGINRIGEGRTQYQSQSESISKKRS